MLSMVAAVGTVVLKTAAWYLTGSVGLLSDALESLVNVAAAAATWGALSLAAKPPDEEHAFGHDKIEFFAGGFEGALVLGAATGIFYAAIPRFFDPRALEGVTIGLVISGVAALINLIVARVLCRAGSEHHSPALAADGRHLFTDVWTSVGVIGGLILATVTGWHWLDPLLAIAVGCYVLYIGGRLVYEAVHGLLDRALPTAQRDAVKKVLEDYSSKNVQFHALRTRSSGARQFVAFHVLVPDEWSVRKGHDLLEKIESDLREVLPNGIIFTHLEPLSDPASWEDQRLDRKD